MGSDRDRRRGYTILVIRELYLIFTGYYQDSEAGMVVAVLVIAGIAALIPIGIGTGLVVWGRRPVAVES